MRLRDSHARPDACREVEDVVVGHSLEGCGHFLVWGAAPELVADSGSFDDIELDAALAALAAIDAEELINCFQPDAWRKPEVSESLLAAFGREQRPRICLQD
jgi:hypothetical protein